MFVVIAPSSCCVLSPMSLTIAAAETLTSIVKAQNAGKLIKAAFHTNDARRS
jgi:hypothetical protein